MDRESLKYYNEGLVFDTLEEANEYHEEVISWEIMAKAHENAEINYYEGYEI